MSLKWNSKDHQKMLGVQCLLSHTGPNTNTILMCLYTHKSIFLSLNAGLDQMLHANKLYDGKCSALPENSITCECKTKPKKCQLL